MATDKLKVKEVNESGDTQKLVLPKIDKVIIHPLVLLSVVDHFNRMGKVGNVKRVVGILLGSQRGSILDVANSFAVPFDEDEKDHSVWFLDHDYLETMCTMFKKVNAREKIVGWYHTGPKLHKNDIGINDLICKYNPNCVLVIIDAEPRDLGLPTDAYISVEEIHDDGTPTTKTFDHLPSEMGAEEAEEVGVEHLLRDIKDTTVGSLSQRISSQLVGLKGLHSKLQEICKYLNTVADGTMPINHQIVYLMQDAFNLLPDVASLDFVKSIHVKTNDQMLVLYLSSLVRAIISLHNLINNKITNKEAERIDGRVEKKDKDKDVKDDEKKKEDSKNAKETTKL